MKLDCFVGIDLGSTTTKSIYLDENENIIGRGITNSRSNYDIACQVAKEEAEISSRFTLLERKLEADATLAAIKGTLLPWLTSKYRHANHLTQLNALKLECANEVAKRDDNEFSAVAVPMLDDVFKILEAESQDLFRPNVGARSDFFRDIAASGFLQAVEKLVQNNPKLLDRMIGIFDKAILVVEGKSYANAFSQYIKYATEETVALPQFKSFAGQIREATNYAANVTFNALNTIGTGYGRQRLPFPKEQIRSEILCHGLGAHYMFPKTTTVLDIGGQDTKAIQIDGRGIVTNFQMNDRCAAGCGRYLGYIADEMNMGVHELGPLAQKSTLSVKINSTCTVFAGTELRERLSMGEKREDILAGLHRSMILRAMSLLARSGGIFDEFTFTGGVAKNPAAVAALKKLVEENYGERVLNISPDSIFTGALGAAIFAKRGYLNEMEKINLEAISKKEQKQMDAF